MSDWFRSVPHGLDAIACAVKSQQDTMASLVRYYKLKCTQQRATIIKMKDCVAENKSLQRYFLFLTELSFKTRGSNIDIYCSQVEQLQQELSQLRGIAGGTTNQSYDQMPYGANRHDAVNQALSYQPSETRNVNGKRPLADPHPNQRYALVPCFSLYMLTIKKCFLPSTKYFVTALNNDPHWALAAHTSSRSPTTRISQWNERRKSSG